MAHSMTGASVIKRSADHVATDMAGETVVLDMKSGMYYGMDHVGALIWALLSEPRTLAEIRDAVVKQYDIDAESSERDVISFLGSLESAGLVEISNEQGS